MSNEERTVERVAVGVETACDMMGVGRTTLYALIAAGELRSFNEGRRRLVSVASIREWAARRANTNEAA